jgi:inner membrane protein involved in colicin E2 resistance
MTAKNFFIFQTFLSVSFGIGLILAPQMLIDMYANQKAEISGILDTISRGYGTLLTAFGILAYLSRNAKPSQLRQAFFISSCIGNTLVTIVHIRAILQGTENTLSWTIVLATAAAAVWSGLLLSKEKEQILD